VLAGQDVLATPTRVVVITRPERVRGGSATTGPVRRR